MATLDQINKEMTRLEGEMKEISNQLKPMKEQLKNETDEDKKKEIQVEINKLFAEKDKKKSDWYLLNAEKTEKENGVKQ